MAEYNFKDLKGETLVYFSDEIKHRPRSNDDIQKAAKKVS